MSAATAVRVLPRDLYDALELSALAWGGIGGGRAYERTGMLGELAPYCVLGHLALLDGEAGMLSDPPSMHLLRLAGISTDTNDRIVLEINRRRHRPLMARVPFVAWVRELGVIRGTR